jgi:hypothetical protein
MPYVSTRLVHHMHKRPSLIRGHGGGSCIDNTSLHGITQVGEKIKTIRAVSLAVYAGPSHSCARINLAASIDKVRKRSVIEWND